MRKSFKSSEGMTKSKPDMIIEKFMKKEGTDATGVNMDDNKNWAKICFRFDRKLSEMRPKPIKVIELWEKMLKRY